MQRALDFGYRFLGKRERTRQEMLGHLAGKDVAQDTAEQAVAELERQGYVDDARYAQRFAEDRRALDSWGSERIERRLLELGVDREHVGAAVGERDRAAELEAAIDVLRRRLPAAPSTDRERERALGLLARRGYELDLAHDAIRALARSQL